MTTTPAFAAEQFLGGWFAIEPEPPPGVAPATYRRTMASRFQNVQADLVARLESEPWVSDVTIAARPPGGEAMARIEVEGLSGGTTGSTRELRVNEVDDDFFEAFGAKLLTGRSFTPADRAPRGDAATSRGIVVNRAFVDQVLSGGSAVGRRVREISDSADKGDAPNWQEIVGVVADLHTNAVDPALVAPVVYRPLTPGSAATGSLVLRVPGGAPATHIARLRELTATVDPTVRLFAFPLVEIYRQESVAMRLIAAAVALVTASVLLLSAAGIYALMSFAVAQRRKEIGIRAALGADARRILGTIFARAAGQLAIGIGLGLAAAMLVDAAGGGEMIGPTRAILLPAMAALMLAVGLLASIGPARRGLRIQPTEALRAE
jgi:putative ABC transport system permease protein